jgi:hypothetical protein
MANIATVTVYDGAGTPAVHTLKAVSVTRERGKITALWRETLSTVPEYGQLRLICSTQKQPNGVWVVHRRFEQPYMESVSGQNAAGYTAAPKVAYVNTEDVTNFFHERSDQTGRRNVRMMSCNFANNVTTSVAAATSGTAADLVDDLLMPT